MRALTPDILEVDLDLDDSAALSFEAGQWVSVPFGPKNVRAYSIASTPRSAGRITLCADVAPAGIGSAWFRSLAVGQTIEFKAPFGGFVFRRDDPRRPLFVAKEIGIVPIRAMLADLDVRGRRHDRRGEGGADGPGARSQERSVGEVLVTGGEPAM